LQSENVERVKSVKEAPSMPQKKQKFQTQIRNIVWVNGRRHNNKIGKK
jgi:hypothetical protein